MSDYTFEPYKKPSETKMALDVLQSRRQVEAMQQQMFSVIRALRHQIDACEEVVNRRDTGWMGLFKKTSNGDWHCVATVDTNNLPESWENGKEPEWDMAVPIPEPGTVSEFRGW